MNVPDEAVKATAQAVYEEFRIDMGGAYVEWPKFLSELESEERKPFYSKAKFFLEAAAPTIAAHGWAEGYEMATQDHIAGRIYMHSGNPYKETS